MTVREWFRVQRGEYFRQHAYADLDQLTDKAIRHTPLGLVERVYPVYLVFDVVRYEREGTLIARIQQQMQGALAEIERDMRHRMRLEVYAKDLLS